MKQEKVQPNQANHLEKMMALLWFVPVSSSKNGNNEMSVIIVAGVNAQNKIRASYW